VEAVRVLLAEDQRIFRKGLKKIIVESYGPPVVIGEAVNGHTAVELAVSVRPDVIIMDVGMPVLNGIESTARITAVWPGARILILSAHEELETISGAFRAGARGYILKSEAGKELVRAISAVHDGRFYLSPAVAGVILDRLKSGSLNPHSEMGLLTLVEIRLLELIHQGFSDDYAAAVLGTTTDGVNDHRLSIINKLRAVRQSDVGRTE